MLTEADLNELQLDGDVAEFHDMIKKLRDHYASRHLNPRESFTIGVAQSNDGKPDGRRGGRPRRGRWSTTPRCGCSAGSPTRCPGLLDARMQKTQNDVLGAAGKLSPNDLSGLPVVHLSSGVTASTVRYSRS